MKGTPIMSEQTTQKSRVFKTGAVRIVEDASMSGLSNEEVRSLLKSSYPEVANATIRESQLEDGTPLIEFLPQPGRKG
jgi:PRTRC genetic system protein C